MGNYFSGNKNSTNANTISTDCNVTIFVEKKSLNENDEINDVNLQSYPQVNNPSSLEVKNGGSIEGSDVDTINNVEKYSNDVEIDNPSSIEVKNGGSIEGSVVDTINNVEKYSNDVEIDNPTSLEVKNGGSIEGSVVDTINNVEKYSNDVEIDNNDKSIMNTTETTSHGIKHKKKNKKKNKNNVTVI